MLIDYDLLASFVDVARSPSFAAAARKRHVSQSAISQQMKTLEARLGAPLFERVGRRAQLTKLGERLLQSVETDFANIDRAVSDIMDPEGTEVRGVVKVGAPGPFPKRWLRSRIPKLIAQFPDVAVELVTGEAIDIEHQLVTGKIDLTFHFGFHRSQQMQLEQIAEEELVGVASPSYLSTHRAPRSLDELRDDHVFIANPYLVFEPWWKTVFGASSRMPEQFHCSTPDMEEMAFFATSGVGISVLPTYLIWDSLQSGALVPLPLNAISGELEPMYRKPIHLAWRDTADNSAAVRAVRTVLLEATDEDAWAHRPSLSE